MRGGVAVLAGGLALVIFVGVVAAGPPLVSAGLDQNVVQGDPVYLDAGGTHVPDGELVGLEWSIETPNGSTIDPECVDCEVTWFRATQTGQYDVSLTAESASGVERSDTLYVSVSRWNAGGAPPTSNMSASSGGGGGSNGCFVSHFDVNDPLANGVCNEVGMVVDLQTSSSGDSITHFVFENIGFASDYTGAGRNRNGNIIVPTRYVYAETEALYEQTRSDESVPPIGNGNYSDSIASNPGGETSETIDGNGDMDFDSCNNVPSRYCKR